MTTPTDNTRRPNLSEIEPLPSVEEEEAAAYPGMTPRERRQEQRSQTGDGDTNEPNVIIPIVPVSAAAPGETAPGSAGGPFAPCRRTWRVRRSTAGRRWPSSAGASEDTACGRASAAATAARWSGGTASPRCSPPAGSAERVPRRALARSARRTVSLWKRSSQTRPLPLAGPPTSSPHFLV